MKNKKIVIFLVSFFILLSAVFMGFYYKTMHAEKHEELAVLGNPGHKVGNFSFVNQEGDTITQDDVRGKIYVVEYFFTTCKGICPKMNENMTKVYQAFRGDDEVKILSHTVDPYKDTVAAMKEYSLRFDADPRQWYFLTGGKKELYDIARNGYLITAADDTAVIDIESDFIHTDRFVLVDKEGRLRGTYYQGTDIGEVNNLIGDIKELKKEYAAQVASE